MRVPPVYTYGPHGYTVHADGTHLSFMYRLFHANGYRALPTSDAPNAHPWRRSRHLFTTHAELHAYARQMLRGATKEASRDRH